MTDNKHISENQINHHSKMVLDKSVDELSPELQSRLSVARHAALERLSEQCSSPVLSMVNTKTLCAGLAFSLLALLIWPLLEPSPISDTPSMASNIRLDEFILLTTLDETDLDVIEDIDFAYWLSEGLSDGRIEELDEEGGLDARYNG